MQYLPLLITFTNTRSYIIIAALLFLMVSVFLVFKFGRLYIKSITSGAHVSLLQMIGMTLRRSNARSIVEYRVMAKKAGIDIAAASLESHYLAGGNIRNVVHALITALKANIELSFDYACALDLAGRDVFDAVKTSINPKIIDSTDPDKGQPTLDAITKDGIKLKVKARITIRTRIDKLIGGATEDTIIARVSEGIITAISSADTYKKVLENPDAISKLVAEKTPDSDTAFQILSINIVDITVAENVGARLLAEQAEADRRIAQVEAERRQGLAIARKEEMKALAEENIARMLAAEAEVPKAIAQAFREGNLGIMDYYHLKNIKADTDMRIAISKSGTTPAIK
ncbi:MAG: flotillin-like protein FloA [Candidatus Loosdrechtia sp.]|uniref:flotillin-like FloA family protein n=1 Tax=Candidatus Loosdrechtia sp. TaxID=3101272 RepID=UPI003A6BCAED|nr:MAG: flotillin-like protein FloA [Candidatus Jettenia sp. AMX2]